MDLYEKNFCMMPLSKNGEGELAVRDQKTTKCEKSECATT